MVDFSYISTFENDPNTAQALAEKVLEILQGTDPRYIENELVIQLDYERFDFIKLLFRNRKKISYCTRLAKAQGEAERKQIEEEMLVRLFLCLFLSCLFIFIILGGLVAT